MIGRHHMKKFLAGVALVVATLAVPSAAHADWGTPGTATPPPAPGCTTVKVVKIVNGKVVSTKIVASCPFTPDPS